MANETHTDDTSEIEKRLAKIRGAGDLVDCLTPERAKFCNYSLSFGGIYFCKHPSRNKIIDDTEKLRSKSISLSGVSQSDNQE